MLIILSPAKTLNMDRAENTIFHTKPAFIKEASTLMQELVKYSPPELESLMKINSQLAEQNFKRHISWKLKHSLRNSKQAILAYDGAVYTGIKAEGLQEEELIYANDHVRILSGLYGALKPLDLIQPYRLEMLTKLKNDMGNNLYSFWRDKLTAYFVKEFEKQKDNLFIDLASKEYSSAIDMEKVNARVITPIFKEHKGGTLKVITIYAKRARGLMTRFIIQNRIEVPDELKEFCEEGYSYSEQLSTENEWVFTR